MSPRYKRKKILLKRSYQFLAIVLIIVFAGMLLQSKKQKYEDLSPDIYVKNLLSTERYISSDELAHRMINQDPSLLLIDTRTVEEYQKYSLPGAINIPFTLFFDPEQNLYLDQDIYDVVLFSNDHFLAEEVWMLGNRLDYPNLHVLEGGLNTWFKTIIKPSYPDETLPRDAIELHNFRRAAGKYFGVAKDTIEVITRSKQAPKPKKRVVTKPKKKKRMPEGGC